MTSVSEPVAESPLELSERAVESRTAAAPVVRLTAGGQGHFPNPKELWHYRDLVGLLVWRDISTRYRQTLLGPIWFIAQPVLPALVFTMLLGRVAGLSTDGHPMFLFYLCNQVAWGFLANVFSAVSGSLLGNLHIFSKVYFPRLVVPVAQVASSAVTLGVQLAFLLVAAAVIALAVDSGGEVRLGSMWPSLLALALLGLLGLGFGLWLSALTAKYRDLQQIAPLIVQLWMYGSAVLLPLSRANGTTRRLMELNPATFAIELFRYGFLGSATISTKAGVTSVGIALIVLLSGIYAYQRVAATFVDTA